MQSMISPHKVVGGLLIKLKSFVWLYVLDGTNVRVVMEGGVGRGGSKSANFPFDESIKFASQPRFTCPTSVKSRICK